MSLSLLYPILRSILFRIPPETAHDFTLSTLKKLDNLFKKKEFHIEESSPIELMGLRFPNRVGLAAGLDKGGNVIDAMRRLGFGFVEIGTITPRAQAGNPKPRMFRVNNANALINRMGFNNVGIAQTLSNLKQAKYPGILGINIGKNKDTPLEQAAEDYITGFCAFYPYADYITVNISSPNTPGLRELQKGEALRQLLDVLKEQQAKCEQQHQKRVPLVVKVAPDLMPDEIGNIAEHCLKFQIDGLIATNTTNSRPSEMPQNLAEQAGGLSGAPLHSLSVSVIKQFHQILKDDCPIIGVGGIFSARDAEETIAAGAKLCQIYTGLIYQGPTLVRACIDALRDLKS